jgi:hypothetical protein
VDFRMPETQTSNDGAKGLSAGIIKAGQIAGAITALVGVVVLLWNTLLKPTPAPAVLAAHVSDVRVSEGISEYTYLQSHPGQLAREEAQLRAAAKRNGERPLSQPEIDEALQSPGVEVQWRVLLEGPAGRRFKLTHTLFRHAAGGRSVVGEGLGSYWPNESIVSQAGRYENTEGAWIQLPSRAGTYTVEIYLDSADGTQNSEGAASFQVGGARRG